MLARFVAQNWTVDSEIGAALGETCECTTINVDSFGLLKLLWESSVPQEVTVELHVRVTRAESECDVKSKNDEPPQTEDQFHCSVCPGKVAGLWLGRLLRKARTVSGLDAGNLYLCWSIGGQTRRDCASPTRYQPTDVHQSQVNRQVGDEFCREVGNG
jgi:hypothetical protein